MMYPDSCLDDQFDPRHPEQEALAILRAHRQQSGYIPWIHDDNERLRSVEIRQKQQSQTDQAYREGVASYQQRVVPRQASFVPVAAVIPHVDRVSTPVINEPPAAPPPLEIRIDPELGRLAVGLSKAAEFRLWAIGRHTFGQPGWTTRDGLFESLKDAGVTHSRRNFNRLLKQGQGLFWRVSGDRVYLRSYVKVSQCLTAIAQDKNPDLVATNIPGVRDVYLRVGGDLGDFKAQIYAGWLTYREDPTIARETLCKLFGVTADTLRNWEERLGDDIETVANYAQTAIDPRKDERVVDYLPAHCYNYVTRQGEIRIRWRQPNTYKPKHIRQHSHKGQSRKARFAAAKTAWFQPVEIWAVPIDKLPFDRSHREPRRYFASAKQLRKFLERLERKGQVGATPETPRYVYRGEDRHQHGIWELSLDGEAATAAMERLTIKAEFKWWKGFRQHQRQAKAG